MSHPMIGIVIFPNAEELDFVGPWEVFTMARQSLAGADRDPMPNLTRWSEDGLLFETASAVYPESIKGLWALHTARFPAVDTVAEDYARVGGAAIPDTLRSAGYRTALQGKWHLGIQDHLHPLERGFDEFFGFLPGSHPYFPVGIAARAVWETMQRRKERITEPEYLTHAFAREAD